MAPNRLFTTTEYRGLATGGIDFDDRSIIRDISGVALSRIDVYYSQYIHSLTMHYGSDDAPVTRGGSRDIHAVIILGPGELITTIEGCVVGPLISCLKFVTNHGVMFGPYGGQQTTENFKWKATDNVSKDVAPHMGFLYFSGHACINYIRQLRATFARYPDPVQTIYGDAKRRSCNVKFEKQVPTSDAVSLSTFARNLISPVVAIHVGPDPVVFHAYEAILCRIPFFRAALQGEFLEAAEKKITMPEEKSEIFSMLIEHLYTGSYTYTYNPDATTDADDAPTIDLAEGRFHVSVYAVAFRYDWQPLVDDAVRNFLIVLPMLRGIDIVRLWKAAYEDGLTITTCTREGPLVEFQRLLPGLWKGLCESDADEMRSVVTEFPELAYDFMHLLVADGED